MGQFKINDIVERVSGEQRTMKIGETDRVISLMVFDDTENPSLALENNGQWWYPENFKIKK